MGFYNNFAFIAFAGMCLFQISHSEGPTWKSGPPDGLPELKKLSVDCGKEEMTIHLEFTAPYDGSVYSKSNGQSKRCIHVAPHSHITQTVFSINYHSCGTRSDSHEKYYENTIIIQYDDIVIEAWDEAKKIRCEWHDGYEKSAYKMPITISDLDVVEMNFQGDDVDCWLEVQDGKGPWSAKVEGLVPLGSPLTLVVAIQDSESQFDMRVKSCIAHDGHKHPIHLTDEDGCVLRPKMMSSFQKTSDTKGTASVIAYSHFYAFKFPETVEVTIQCTVEICRHGCPDTCYQGRDAQSANLGEENLPAQGKEQEIPTYKDSHPFSTVITSKPGYNYTSNVNESSSINGRSNFTKDDVEPLKGSPDTHHSFYVDRFPFDLYDVLEAEERQDKNEHELFTDDDKYSENKDHIYFPQLPNLFPEINEQSKHFSHHQEIMNVTDEESVITEQSENSNIMEDATLSTIRKETESSIEELGVTDKIKNNKKQNNVYHQNKLNQTNKLEIIGFASDIPVADEEKLSSKFQSHTQVSEENTLNQLLSSEFFEEDLNDSVSTKIQNQSASEQNVQVIEKLTHGINSQSTVALFQQSTQDLNESLPESNLHIAKGLLDDSHTHLSKENEQKSKSYETGLQHESELHIMTESQHDFNMEDINSESRQNYNDADVKNKDKLDNYYYSEKPNLNKKQGFDKKITERHFEDYKIKARKPLDNNEMRHNIHNYNYRPFMPPAPMPPLTLYNGLPLYYYNHPNTNVELLERDGYIHTGRQPYDKEYIKSKLRRPGRRRGRREIGEKEQLGLKQTLRVIATTDFDFLIKDNDKIKPIHVGKSSTEKDVCIAPSSFAAGLGLLLLANICVLCVVIFLGHHYNKYRHVKEKNTELLSTEMT